MRVNIEESNFNKSLNRKHVTCIFDTLQNNRYREPPFLDKELNLKVFNANERIMRVFLKYHSLRKIGRLEKETV